MGNPACGLHIPSGCFYLDLSVKEREEEASLFVCLTEKSAHFLLLQEPLSPLFKQPLTMDGIVDGATNNHASLFIVCILVLTSFVEPPVGDVDVLVVYGEVAGVGRATLTYASTVYQRLLSFQRGRYVP